MKTSHQTLMGLCDQIRLEQDKIPHERMLDADHHYNLGVLAGLSRAKGIALAEIARIHDEKLLNETKTPVV